MAVCSRHPLQQATPAVNTNMTTADIVAVGSGHNGLVAAAYLAAGGKKVLVLERNAWFGGGVVSRELTLPGFRHDQHSMSHIFIQANPLLKNDELGLKSRYGLEYIFPEVPMMSVFEDGSTLKLYRDRERSAAEIAKFSKRDAEAFRRVSLQAAAWLPMIASSLYAPPAPVGATYAMFDQSREGRELWRIMQMSSHDLLCEQFEHEQVRTHFARVAGENLVSPDEKATAIGVYVFLGFLEGWLRCGTRRRGQVDRCLHRLYPEPRRRSHCQCRCGAHQGAHRRRSRCRDGRRPEVWGERRRHRCHSSTLARRHDRRHGLERARRRRGHAHHCCGLHHGACRAQRAAEVPHRRPGRCGHGRDAADELRNSAARLRRTALRSVHAIPAPSPRLPCAVRPYPPAPPHSHSAFP